LALPIALLEERVSFVRIRQPIVIQRPKDNARTKYTTT